jgi:osmotically-inducible protein OsmY
MIATAPLVDAALRDTVARHLEWDPEIDSRTVAVFALGSAVTLTGFINSYAGKLAAERIAKRVRGVRAVANDIQVRLRLARADDDIASDAAHALATRTELPDSVQAVVRHGHVTLTGAVPSLFHRSSAERAVRHIKGVVDVTNRIAVLAAASPEDIVHRISDALHRIADVNARYMRQGDAERPRVVVGATGRCRTGDRRRTRHLPHRKPHRCRRGCKRLTHAGHHIRET